MSHSNVFRARVSAILVLVLAVCCHRAHAVAPTPTLSTSLNDTPTSEPTPSTDPVVPTVDEPTPLETASTAPEPALPASTPAPTPTSSEASMPTSALSNDMRKILRKVGRIPCNEPWRSRMFAILYDSNVVLHDTCIADSGYQFFPYTGVLPTTKQIVATTKSKACMDLYAGVILAEFPECDIDFVSVRSSAEIYYRIKKDMDAGRAPPTQAQFYEFYNLNRVVNLLNENATLIETVFRDSPTTAAVSLSEITRLMNAIALPAGVTLGDDMTVRVAEGTLSPSPSSSSSPRGTPKASAKDPSKTTSAPPPSVVNSTIRSSCVGSSGVRAAVGITAAVAMVSLVT